MDFCISKTAQLCDERHQSWSDTYRVPSVTGDYIEVVIPREDRDPGTLRKRLLRGGANIPLLDHCRQELILASESDARIIHRAARTGWKDEGAIFVGHTFVAGIDDDSVHPPLASNSGIVGNIGRCGTLNDWQQLVKVAKHSTALMVSLSAAFAAPLLSRLQRPSFGIVLVAPSRAGKSITQVFGASAIGFGEEEHLPTLNTTPAGLLESGLLFNDHMLPINEVGTAKGKKADIHAVLRDATYSLTSGKDVTRHSSWGQGDTAGGSFKVLLVLSSERSPDEWAERGGETREAGETARLIGVPVLFGDYQTIFDRPPEFKKSNYKRWVRRQFERLRVGLPNQRGEALRSFTTWIASRREEVITDAAEYIDAFERALRKEATSAIKSDIIAKFGVLYAGGMTAIDAGVLLLDGDLLGKALTKACKGALKSLPNPEADLSADLKIVAKYLGSAGVIDADEASTSQKRMMEQADGYFSKDEKQSGKTYVTRADKFVELFRSRSRAIGVMEWLDKEGYLRHQRERKAGKSLEWAQTHTVWPNHQRIRSFVLYFPSGLDVLDIQD